MIHKKTYYQDELLTEDEVVEILCQYLKKKGWEIIHKAKGHQRGPDIKASKNDKVLVVEAKGARGNPKSPVTKKPKFSSGENKTNLGEAIVKVLEEKNKDPKINIAIALPNHDHIKKTLTYAVPEVIKIGINLFWISKNGNVEEEKK